MTLAVVFDTFGVYVTTHVVVINRAWRHHVVRLVRGSGLVLVVMWNIARSVLRAVRRRVSFGMANATSLVEKRGANHFAVRTWLVLDKVAGVLCFGTPRILANLAKWGRTAATVADAAVAVRLGISISAVRHSD